MGKYCIIRGNGTDMYVRASIGHTLGFSRLSFNTALYPCKEEAILKKFMVITQLFLQGGERVYDKME